MNKKGALELSFGMIFAIILIAVFIAFAFFGIKKFLVVQDLVKYKGFTEDLQSDVNKVWKSAQASNQVHYSLPSKITEVCFENQEKRNLLFYPRSSEFPSQTIINLNNLEMFVNSEEPICFNNTGGTVTMTLSKEYSQNLVTIK